MTELPTPQRPTWCEIDLSVVKENVALLRGMVGSGVAIFVCLKGDASGCGDVAVGRAVQDSGVAGVEGLAFGNLDRAVAARDAGVRLPILLTRLASPTRRRSWNGMISCRQCRPWRRWRPGRAMRRR